MDRKEINLETWDRKIFFEFFKKFDKPFWSMTTQVDVTELVKFCKQTKYSFYASMSYIVLASCNAVQNFRLRCENDKIYDYSQVNGQFTALTKSGNADIARRIHFNQDFDTFVNDFISLKLETEEQRIPPHPRELYDDVVFLSCTPWFRFSQLDPVLHYSLKDTIPRITWGKYELVNDRYVIDISLAIHHSFIDGYHVSLFLDEIQNQIKKLLNTKKITI